MVKGEVCDTLTQERLINAVVQFLSVTDTTQQFVAGTDAQEHFLQPLRPGIYNIRISYMGNIYQATPQRIEVQGNTQDIGQLSIGLSDYALNEVTVVAQKPFVRYDGQKMLFNLNAHPLAQGSSAWEGLKVLPRLTLSGQRGLNLYGFYSVALYVDHRPLNMSTSELETFISSLSGAGRANSKPRPRIWQCSGRNSCDHKKRSRE